jgi:DNA-binding CsgD family transcriptional regulator/GAF domain-containing protein
MNRTVNGDERVLLEASRRLLQCRAFDALAETAMQSLQQLLGADSSCLAIAYDSDDERYLYRARGCGLLTSEALRVYQQSYCRSDPVLTDILSHEWDGQERIVVLEHLVDMKRFRATELYADFLRPLHIHYVMGLAVPLDDGARALFGVHRPRRGQRSFDARHIAQVRELLPALAASFNALLTRERLEDREAAIEELARGEPSAGLAVLDDRARVLYADREASEKLRGLRRLEGAGDLAQPAIPRGLRARILATLEAVPSAAAPARLPVQGCDDGRAPQCWIRALDGPAARARYLLTFSADQMRPAGEARLQRLTSRERQIADQVARGLRNPEIATDLSLSVRTIENHLRSIYAKLQVRNRASLAGLLCALGAQPAGRITVGWSGDACRRSTRSARRFRTAA